MTAKQWADSVQICLRRLGPDEQPPHSVTDHPKQYQAILEAIRGAVADENKACREIAWKMQMERFGGGTAIGNAIQERVLKGAS